VSECEAEIVSLHAKLEAAGGVNVALLSELDGLRVRICGRSRSPMCVLSTHWL